MWSWFWQGIQEVFSCLQQCWNTRLWKNILMLSGIRMTTRPMYHLYIGQVCYRMDVLYTLLLTSSIMKQGKCSMSASFLTEKKQGFLGCSENTLLVPNEAQPSQLVCEPHEDDWAHALFHKSSMLFRGVAEPCHSSVADYTQWQGYPDFLQRQGGLDRVPFLWFLLELRRQLGHLTRPPGLVHRQPFKN